MSRYRAGQTLRLTEDGRRVTLWSEAPGSGCWWAHLEGEPGGVQLVRIVNRKDASLPVVTLQEEK